ncbi:hypothetical protein AB1L05_16710 [Cytobacillus horneckiae]
MSDKLERFDKETYEMTSSNNMPLMNEFKPLSAEEQEEVNDIFEIN